MKSCLNGQEENREVSLEIASEHVIKNGEKKYYYLSKVVAFVVVERIQLMKAL